MHFIRVQYIVNKRSTHEEREDGERESDELHSL